MSIDTKSLNANFKQIELMPIKFIKGDATNPTDNGTKIIVHICNDVGGWGKGFVMAISKKWKQPELEYRNWYKDKEAEQQTPFNLKGLKVETNTLTKRNLN